MDSPDFAIPAGQIPTSWRLVQTITDGQHFMQECVKQTNGLEMSMKIKLKEEKENGLPESRKVSGKEDRIKKMEDRCLR